MRRKIKLFKRRVALAHRRRVRTIKRVTKRPLFTVPTATFMVLLLLVAAAFLISSHGKPQLVLRPNNSNVVVINYDHQQRTIPTSAKTVGDLLGRLHVKLNTGDVVEPSKDTQIIGENFRINVYRAVPVTIVDGTQKTFTYSAAATPRSIVQQAGVTVYPEDNLSLLPTDNFIQESSIGERVVIDRATPVNVNLYGTPTVLRTHAKTVAELLKEKNIKLGTGDSVQPAATTVLSANTGVFVIHKGTQIKTEQVPIDMPVQTVDDNTLSFGTTAIRQQGAPGIKLVTYEVDLQNGQVVGQKDIQEIVTQPPVTQIVARGTNFQIGGDKSALMTAAGISPGDFPYVDYIVSHESGWCPTKLQGEIGTCPNSAPASVPPYGGYGLGQATPGSKMASAGSDWEVNPITQLKWASDYAKRTYGSWAAAYNHWVANHNW